MRSGVEFSTCGIGIFSAQVSDFEYLESWDPQLVQERELYFLGHETLELEVESGRLRGYGFTSLEGHSSAA